MSSGSANDVVINLLANEVKKQKDELTRSEAYLAEVTARQDQRELQRVDLEESLAAAQRDLKKANRASSKAEKARSDAESDLHTARMALDAARSESSVLQDTATHLAGTVERLRSEHRRNLDEKEGKLRQLTEKHSSSLEQIAKLQKRLSKLEDENTRLRAEEEAARESFERIGKLQRRLTKLEEENIRLRAEEEVSKASLDQAVKLQKRLAKLEEDNTRLRAEEAVSRVSVDQNVKLQKRLSKLEEENERLRDGEDASRESFEQLTKLQKRLSKLEEENERLRDGEDTSRESLEQVAKLQKRLNRLEDENARLKANEQSSRESRESLERTKAILVQVANDSKERTNKATTQKEQIQKELEQLRGRHGQREAASSTDSSPRAAKANLPARENTSKRDASIAGIPFIAAKILKGLPVPSNYPSGDSKTLSGVDDSTIDILFQDLPEDIQPPMYAVLHEDEVLWSPEKPLHGFTVRYRYSAQQQENIPQTSIEKYPYGTRVEVVFHAEYTDSWSYIGTYLILGLPDLVPAAFNALPDNISSALVSRTNAATGIESERVRTAFQSGGYTALCFGLQCVGFDQRLFNALSIAQTTNKRKHKEGLYAKPDNKRARQMQR